MILLSSREAGVAPIWYPENYCARTVERCQPPYDGPPHYPGVPMIEVIDRALGHLDRQRRRFWRRAREAALLQWTDFLHFDIVDAPPYSAGFVTLDVTPTHDGTAGQADFGALPEYPAVPEPEIPAAGVAWAHVNAAWFEQQFASNIAAELRKVIAHEVGHTLGFGHGGTGVMQQTHQGKVNAEELQALADYWGAP